MSESNARSKKSDFNKQKYETSQYLFSCCRKPQHYQLLMDTSMVVCWNVGIVVYFCGQGDIAVGKKSLKSITEFFPNATTKAGFTRWLVKRPPLISAHHGQSSISFIQRLLGHTERSHGHVIENTRTYAGAPTKARVKPGKVSHEAINFS